MADEQWPITLEMAAERLRWKRGIRALKTLVTLHRIGRRVGRGPNSIVLDEQEYQRLYESLPRPGERIATAYVPEPPDWKVRSALKRHFNRGRPGRRGPRKYLKAAAPPKLG